MTKKLENFEFEDEISEEGVDFHSLQEAEEDDDDGETNPIETSGGGGGGFLGGLGEAKSEAESQGDKILERHEGQISVNGKGRKI